MFLKVAGMLLAASATMGIGCNNDIKSLIKVIIASGMDILKITPSPVWEQRFRVAVDAFQRAFQAWQSGGPNAALHDAIDHLFAVISAIPGNDAAAPLLTVLVAGLRVVVNKLWPGSQIPQTPFDSKVTMPDTENAAEYKLQWNEAAQGTLSGAKLP
jgi:hypothetical protein